MWNKESVTAVKFLPETLAFGRSRNELPAGSSEWSSLLFCFLASIWLYCKKRRRSWVGLQMRQKVWRTVEGKACGALHGVFNWLSGPGPLRYGVMMYIFLFSIEIEHTYEKCTCYKCTAQRNFTTGLIHVTGTQIRKQSITTIASCLLLDTRHCPTRSSINPFCYLSLSLSVICSADCTFGVWLSSFNSVLERSRHTVACRYGLFTFIAVEHSIVWEYSSLFILSDAGNFFVFTHPEHPLAEMKIKQGFIPIMATVEVVPGGPRLSYLYPASAGRWRRNPGCREKIETQLGDVCFFSPVVTPAAFPVTDHAPAGPSSYLPLSLLYGPFRSHAEYIK